MQAITIPTLDSVPVLVTHIMDTDVTLIVVDLIQFVVCIPEDLLDVYLLTFICGNFIKCE